MPHVTEHTPKVSTRSVKPYACESSREKRQQDREQDRQTDRHTHTHTDGLSKTTFLDVLGVVRTSQIRSYLEVDFLHDANTSIDMEVKWHICCIYATYMWHMRHICFDMLHIWTNIFEKSVIYAIHIEISMFEPMYNIYKHMPYWSHICRICRTPATCMWHKYMTNYVWTYSSFATGFSISWVNG